MVLLHSSWYEEERRQRKLRSGEKESRHFMLDLSNLSGYQTKSRYPTRVGIFVADTHKREVNATTDSGASAHKFEVEL